MPKVTETPSTESRKLDHIRINLQEDVQFPRISTGLERYRFTHQALPELSLHDIDTSVQVFGKELGSPIMISSMTGGTDAAAAHQQASGGGCSRSCYSNGFGLTASRDRR